MIDRLSWVQRGGINPPPPSLPLAVGSISQGGGRTPPPSLPLAPPLSKASLALMIGPPPPRPCVDDRPPPPRPCVDDHAPASEALG